MCAVEIRCMGELHTRDQRISLVVKLVAKVKSQGIIAGTIAVIGWHAGWHHFQVKLDLVHNHSGCAGVAQSVLGSALSFLSANMTVDALRRSCKLQVTVPDYIAGVLYYTICETLEADPTVRTRHTLQYIVVQKAEESERRF